MVKPKTVPTRPPARGHGSSSRSMTPHQWGGWGSSSAAGGTPSSLVAAPGSPLPSLHRSRGIQQGSIPSPRGSLTPSSGRVGGVKEGPARDFLAVPYGPVLGAQRGGGWTMGSGRCKFGLNFTHGAILVEHISTSMGI